VRLWDVATHRQIGAPILAVNGPIGESLASVNAVAFSPDGDILATAGVDGTARLWDVATRQQIGTPIPAVSKLGVESRDGTIGLSEVAFSPDGGILATVGTDNNGTAQLWDVGFPSDLLQAVCAIAGTSLTPQQWSLYVQSEPYRETC
jgi:WD40 repeat protein